MPAKKRRPKSKPSSFLFVNHNAESLTRPRKDPELVYEKQSHAQRHNLSRRRGLKEPDEAGSSGSSHYHPEAAAVHHTPVNCMRNDEIGDLDLQASAWLSQDTGLPSTSYINPALISSQAISPFGTSRQANMSQSQHGSAALVSHALQATQAHPLFHGQLQVLESLAPSLMQYHVTVLLPEKFYRDMTLVPLQKSRHASAIHTDMQTVLSEPAHLYSFLAAVAMQMRIREEKVMLPNLSDEVAARVPAFFRLRAIESIRRHLDEKITTPGLVTAVQRLVAFEYFNGDYESAHPHLEAMTMMMQGLGGMSTFNDYFVEQLALLDWSGALKRLTKPHLTATWDPGRGTPEIASVLDHLKSSSDGLGSRLHDVIEANGWHGSLTEATADMVEITRFNEWMRQRVYYEPTFCRWALQRHLAIGNRLLHMTPAIDPKEEVLRIALIFFTALTRCPTSGKRCASTSIQSLRQKLGAQHSGFGWGADSDVLLWITVIGAFISRTAEYRTWFVGLARTSARVLGVITFGELETLMGAFLFERELHHEPLRSLAAEMSLD